MKYFSESSISTVIKSTFIAWLQCLLQEQLELNDAITALVENGEGIGSYCWCKIKSFHSSKKKSSSRCIKRRKFLTPQFFSFGKHSLNKEHLCCSLPWGQVPWVDLLLFLTLISSLAYFLYHELKQVSKFENWKYHNFNWHIWMILTFGWLV